MATALATESRMAEVSPGSSTQAKKIEEVLITGDLAKLSTEERTQYYLGVCKSVGLNPLTKPFDYIVLNGKMVLYARKDATDQLRNLKGVSITSLESKREGDILIVTASATAGSRTDVSTGAVALGMLKGEALANAYMKAETKAKRRVTLSICGLGILDETEVDSIPNAKMGGEEAPGQVVDNSKIEQPDLDKASLDGMRDNLHESLKRAASMKGKEVKVVFMEGCKNLGFKEFNWNYFTQEQLARLQSWVNDLLGENSGIAMKIEEAEVVGPSEIEI